MRAHTRQRATADKFKHLLGTDGKWAVRDDVWIHYLNRKGRLTAGFGVKEDRIGPELGFGWVVGDAFDEPVLLVKLAWGGKSLAKDFRPPGAGVRSGCSARRSPTARRPYSRTWTRSSRS